MIEEVYNYSLKKNKTTIKLNKKLLRRLKIRAKIKFTSKKEGTRNT
jgi:hypothetical protein